MLVKKAYFLGQFPMTGRGLVCRVCPGSDKSVCQRPHVNTARHHGCDWLSFTEVKVNTKNSFSVILNIFFLYLDIDIYINS